MVDDSGQQFEDALRGGPYEAAWRYCCRLTSTYEDAQDLLQDALDGGGSDNITIVVGRTIQRRD